MGNNDRKKSTEPRANSKEPRAKSQPKDAKATPSGVVYAQVPLPAAESVAMIANLGTIEEKKQFIGNLIYPCI
jgi:hypothetical protein